MQELSLSTTLDVGGRLRALDNITNKFDICSFEIDSNCPYHACTEFEEFKLTTYYLGGDKLRLQVERCSKYLKSA